MCFPAYETNPTCILQQNIHFEVTRLDIKSWFSKLFLHRSVDRSLRKYPKLMTLPSKAVTNNLIWTPQIPWTSMKGSRPETWHMMDLLWDITHKSEGYGFPCQNKQKSFDKSLLSQTALAFRWPFRAAQSGVPPHLMRWDDHRQIIKSMSRNLYSIYNYIYLLPFVAIYTLYIHCIYIYDIFEKHTWYFHTRASVNHTTVSLVKIDTLALGSQTNWNCQAFKPPK